MRRLWQVGLVALCAAVSASPAAAHARLRNATLAANGTIVRSPMMEAAVAYSEGVKPRFSTIEAHDAAGRRVDKQDASKAPDNNRVGRVSLTPSAPGTHRSTWHTTAANTHGAEGSFSFTVMS